MITSNFPDVRLVTDWQGTHPEGTWRLYNVASTSMQSQDVASTLRRRCMNVMCPLGSAYKMACTPSEDSDQPGHPPNLIRVFAGRMKKAWVLSYPLSAQQILWSGWANAQAGLGLRWAHMPFCWFCRRLAHIFMISEGKKKRRNRIMNFTLFVCVEVLRPSQPNGVTSSAVSLPNHTFTGQA